MACLAGCTKDLIPLVNQSRAREAPAALTMVFVSPKSRKMLATVRADYSLGLAISARHCLVILQIQGRVVF